MYWGPRLPQCWPTPGRSSPSWPPQPHSHSRPSEQRLDGTAVPRHPGLYFSCAFPSNSHPTSTSISTALVRMLVLVFVILLRRRHQRQPAPVLHAPQQRHHVEAARAHERGAAALPLRRRGDEAVGVAREGVVHEPDGLGGAGDVHHDDVVGGGGGGGRVVTARAVEAGHAEAANLQDDAGPVDGRRGLGLLAGIIGGSGCGWRHGRGGCRGEGGGRPRGRGRGRSGAVRDDWVGRRRR